MEEDPSGDRGLAVMNSFDSLERAKFPLDSASSTFLLRVSYSRGSKGRDAGPLSPTKADGSHHYYTIMHCKQYSLSDVRLFDISESIHCSVGGFGLRLKLLGVRT